MSEFTPGPWTFDGPPDNIHVVSAAQPHMRICFLTSNGPTEANARLIAAAPDMRKENIQLREEIERLKAALREIADMQSPNWNDMLDIARAALEGK